MAPFGGYLMPIQYSGIIDEHRAVRTAAGLFDLSHMGEFRVTGQDAVTAVDYLVTNDIRGLSVGQVRYTPMCYPDGGIVDDLLVYRLADHLMLVVNASNIGKDLEWIQGHLNGDAQVRDVSVQTALIAVQGPMSESILQPLTEIDLAAIEYYYFVEGECCGVQAVVSRTGYTGEDGFELYIKPEDASKVWRAVLDAGRAYVLKPIGLGARDTLRLESGYMLYGNDIDETTSPLEAGLAWTVKLEGDNFVGREFLRQQKDMGVPRRMVAVEMDDRAIPRPHSSLCFDGERIGELTSGTFSPTFSRGIGLGYVASGRVKIGNPLQVNIRDQLHPAHATRKPLYKRDGGQ